MRLVIDRSRWRRGCGPGIGRLRDENGLQCCLGFLGEACGVADEHLLDVAYPNPPSWHSDGDHAWPSWLFAKLNGESYDERTIIAILNDSRCWELTDAERERRVSERFARHGVEVEFVDGPVSP